MRIFFGFSDSNLGFSLSLQNFPQGFVDDFFIIDDFDIFKISVVVGHCHKIEIQFFHSKFWKILLRKNFCKFTTSVCTKIVENNHITFLNIPHRILVFIS